MVTAIRTSSLPHTRVFGLDGAGALSLLATFWLLPGGDTKLRRIVDAPGIGRKQALVSDANGAIWLVSLDPNGQTAGTQPTGLTIPFLDEYSVNADFDGDGLTDVAVFEYGARRTRRLRAS